MNRFLAASLILTSLSGFAFAQDKEPQISSDSKNNYFEKKEENSAKSNKWCDRSKENGDNCKRKSEQSDDKKMNHHHKMKEIINNLPQEKKERAIQEIKRHREEMKNIIGKDYHKDQDQ